MSAWTRIRKNNVNVALLCHSVTLLQTPTACTWVLDSVYKAYRGTSGLCVESYYHFNSYDLMSR